MRSPFRSFTRFTASSVLSLLTITAILLGYNLLSTEYAKYGALEQEQSVLRKVKNDLEGVRDKLAKELLARIPQPGTSLNQLADHIKSLASEINTKQAARQKLWNDHPSERYLPTSSTFREIAVLDAKIAFLQQGLIYVRNLHTFGTGPLEAERQLKWFLAESNQLAIKIYENKKAQWGLSKQEPLMWRVPFSNAYRQMKELENKEHWLQSSKDQHDAEITRQQGILETLRQLPHPGLLVLDQAPSNRAIQSINNRLLDNDKQLEGSNISKFMRPVKEVLPIALWILALALISPLLVKSIAYYAIAPIAAGHAPILLLPEWSGKISTSIGTTGDESGPTSPSRVSLPLSINERSELLILPSYLQGMSFNTQSDTRWLLDWSMPLTSLFAGMYRLTRIRSNSDDRITVSSSLDPLAEFSLLDVPTGSALVLQPSCLVGVIQTQGQPLKITRHWRFGNLSAWLTLQFRYIVFHGPAQLIVKGCRGIRVEPALDMTINQATTLGFSANLAYSVARNETFWSYYFGERELFNDRWQGDGYCIHAETPNSGDHSGLFGRGLQGLLDTFLKIFGI